MNAYNALYSGATLKKIHAICAEEVAIRTQIVWDSVVRAHKAVGSPFTETLAADIKEEVNNFTQEIVEEVGREMAGEMHFMKGDARRYNLHDARDSAIQKIDVEADLYVDSLVGETKGETSADTGSKTIFISHANEDASLAETIKTQIDNVFEKKVDVFVSSIPGTISPGSDWFDKIIGNLTANNAFIVLVTPFSEKRPFVWFEIGFSWLRRLNKKCEIYAICVPPINPGDLPEPLCRLQAITITDEKQTIAFFDKLIKQFGLGTLGALEFAKILNSLPTYQSNITQSENIGISDEAKQLLLEASLDPSGYILKIRYMGGAEIQTNGKNLTPDNNPQSIAKWEHALEELLENGFVEERGGKGEVFAVTHTGYSYADNLKKGNLTKENSNKSENYSKEELAVIEFIAQNGEGEVSAIENHLLQKHNSLRIDAEAAISSLAQSKTIRQSRAGPICYKLSPEGSIWASKNKHLWLG